MNINNKIPSIPTTPQKDPAWEDKKSPLWQAAKGMESNFLKEMMRNMRKTVDENEADKNNKGLQIFRGMLDDQYAEKAAHSQGIGLADLIVKQILEQNKPQTPSVPIRNLEEKDIKRD